MELDQMLYVPEIVLVFPDFQLKSLLKVVQFLYTGEVGECYLNKDFLSFFLHFYYIHRFGVGKSIVD